MIGKLTGVSNGVSTTLFDYDSFGHFKKSEQTTSGASYDFSYSYYLTGAPHTITYPNSNRVVTYTIDNAGRLTSASGVLGGVQTQYATVSAFAPHGAIQTMTFNNGLGATENTIFNSRLQPMSIVATKGTVNLLNLAYQYCSDFSDTGSHPSCANHSAGSNDGNGNNGNIWRQGISFDAITPAAAFSETQSYQYDGYNRLLQALAGSWTQTNGYDAVGNRWVSGYPGLPSPTSETPQTTSWFTATNRMSTTAGAGWTYDSMGNVTSVGGTNRAFTYDGENRQISATVNGVGATFGYDADGKRVTKAVQGGATTVFIYDAEGQLAQEISSAAPTDTGVSYLTADHLGEYAVGDRFLGRSEEEI